VGVGSYRRRPSLGGMDAKNFLFCSLDAALIGRLYDLDRKVTLYVTFIHVVVSILLGSMIVAGFILVQSAP